MRLYKGGGPGVRLERVQDLQQLGANGGGFDFSVQRAYCPQVEIDSAPFCH